MSFSPSQPENPPLVDGVTQSEPVSETTAVPADSQQISVVKRDKRLLLTLSAAGYTIYFLWCIALGTLLPSPTGALQQLTKIGLLSFLVAGGIFVVVGIFLFLRITNANVEITTKRNSLIKAVLAVIPGILISIVMPFLITREPTLTLDMTPSTELIAPLAITFDAKRAMETLQKRGLRPLQYLWDTDSDGKPNDTTVVPQTTTLFEKPGTYSVVLRINLDGGEIRRASRRIIISQAVFTVTPAQPIVEKPVRFSVAGLLTDPKLLKQVEWDFDGDGTMDQATKIPEAMNVYYVKGSVKVTALIQLQNQTQQKYERTIDVQEPPPLPFPVTFLSEPKTLVGPAPFGAIFSLVTSEPIKEVEWSFGEGKPERGAELRRVSHSFDSPAIYSVVAKVRSASGKVAELSTLVRVTEMLQISDLTFDGSPQPDGEIIKGEVPLSIQLTPKTSLPLVQFSWEVPDATTMDIQGDMLQAIYRREGTYKISLLAQGPEGKAFRKPITIIVQPPAIEPMIRIRPENGVAPLQVVMDASETFVPPGEKVAGFKWKFGDEKQGGLPLELGTARVEHTYTQPGEFAIELAVVMASGKQFTTRRTIIVRRPPLSACVTASRVTVPVGKGVEFDSSCSTGTPVSYVWDVRSNATPNVVLAQSPLLKYVHVFDTPGAHTITLKIKDQSNYEATKSITITVTP